MGHERQHIDVANYFHERGFFRDLGGHFSRCEKPELSLMNAEAAYPEQVAKGMQALTETATSHDILKLAKAVKGYDTLWEGLKSGFAAGLEARLAKNANDHDLIHLALGVKAYPELEKILYDALTAKGHALQIKAIDAIWGERHSVISWQRANEEPKIYVRVHGSITRIEDLAAQDNDLRRLAEHTFSQRSPV